MSGTSVTLQLAVGFTLTVVTIWLVPVVRDAAGWGWAFLILAPRSTPGNCGDVAAHQVSLLMNW